MTCAGNPSTLDLGVHFPPRQVGSTREIYMYRTQWYLQPIDLSNAVVTFRMVDADTGIVKLDAGIGAGSTTGVATYQPAAADVDTPGIYRCQFTATYGGATYVTPWIQARIIRNVETPPPIPPIPDPPVPPVP